jgi:predicted HTH domain antitoxin
VRKLTPIGVRVSEVIATRLDNALAKEFREIEAEMKTDTSEAARRLLAQGIRAYKRERVLKLLGAGKMTVARAARELGISIYELLDLVKREKVAVSYGIDDLRRDAEAKI